MNPYVDPDSGVMFNKLGITDRDALRDAEYKLTRLRGLELQNSPVVGRYDLEHYKSIHKHLFQDVYDWAGQVRTINFSKRNAEEPWWKTRFENHELIKDGMEAVAGHLKAANYLRDLTQQEFAKRIVPVYAAVNALHPAPEGNGRTTQTMLKQLALEAGHNLDFGKVTPEQWVKAAANSMQQENVREPALKRKGDLALLEAAFAKIVVPRREVALEANEARSAREHLAKAFATMPEDQARRAFPQLAGAFDRLNAVALEVQRRGYEPAAASYVMEAARAQIGRQLAIGQHLPQSRSQTGPER